jgi:uncharacterized membrane protein
MRLAWPPPWHLIASVLISVIALALVHLPPPSLQGALSIPALIFVFLIPGYLATLSLFPGKSDLSGHRRAFICLATSALLAGLFSLILTATPRGLQIASLATILSLLAILLAAVAYGRWSNLPRNRRFLLLPKRGLGSARALPRISLASIMSRRAALAIFLLAACFIAALAFAFGPYQSSPGEPITELEGTWSWPQEALSPLYSYLEEGKKLFVKAGIINYEKKPLNYTLNNSGPSISKSIALNSTDINSTRFNATDINSTKINATENNSPVIFEDKSKVTVLSAGGGGMSGGMGGSTGGGSSSSSSQTEAKKPASQKALQPEKTASSVPTVASIAASKVQSNASVAGKNVSSLSIPSNGENQTGKNNLTLEENTSLKDNLTLNRAGTQEIVPAAKPAPLPSSTVAANETKAATGEILTSVQASAALVTAPSPDSNISSKLAASEPPIKSNVKSNESSSSAALNVNADASNGTEKMSEKNAPTKEGSSNESDLSRAISQSEIELDKQGQGTANSNRLPILTALVPDRASPQQLGAAIFWKAEATDEEGDKILYKFLLDGREVRKWSKTNSWSWLSQGLPAGDYQISVLAIDGEHASQDSFDSIINASFTLSRPNQAPVLQELKSDKASPQSKGSMITWMASATDSDNDKIYYKFMKNDEDVTDWSVSNSWVWDTSSEKPGDYRIAVMAKDGLHASKDSFDSSLDSTFVLTSLNSIPEVTALKGDRSSPQAKGAVITWNAIAVDPDGDEIAYKFLANEKEVREWSSSNSWVWETSSNAPGEYRIKVLARDGKHASEDSFDSFRDAVITITIADSNQLPVLKVLVPDIASPAVQGATVIWKAEAQDPEGDKILYKFQLNGRDMSRWSESTSWKWSSRDLPAGDYKIRVLARDGNHASEDSFDSSMDAVFSLISEIDQQIDQLMKKRSAEASQQEDYQSSDIRVASGNGTNSNVVLGKSNSTAGQEKSVTPRKLGG